MFILLKGGEVMDIEKINDDVIRVTITLSDLEERDIDIDALAYSSPAAKELFNDMIEQAEQEFGFSVSDSQIIIEPIPDSYEGFVITITRMDDEVDFESIQKYIKSKIKKSDTRPMSKKRPAIPFIIYSVESFDNLCELCGILKPIFKGKNSVYKLEDTWYLVLGKEKLSGQKLIKAEAVLDEYGHRLGNPGYFIGRLNEYGSHIIKNNAINTLSKHFK